MTKFRTRGHMHTELQLATTIPNVNDSQSNNCPIDDASCLSSEAIQNALKFAMALRREGVFGTAAQTNLVPTKLTKAKNL